MDTIIQVLLFPLVCPIFAFLIFMENRKEKEKKDMAKDIKLPEDGIFREHFPSMNELRAKKKPADTKKGECTWQALKNSQRQL